MCLTEKKLKVHSLRRGFGRSTDIPTVGCLRWPNPANGAANLLEDRTRPEGAIAPTDPRQVT